jgi:hypothetical protein
MRKLLKDKLRQIAKLVHGIAVDSEINVTCCMPGVTMTSQTCNTSEEPYVMIEYVVDKYTKPTRKIHMTRGYLNHDPRVIADLITYSIQQFKTEIDSVQMG